jgi:hypothetical protein
MSGVHVASITNPKAYYAWLTFGAIEAWTAACIWMSVYPLFGLGILKREKKPQLDKWLCLVPEYKLDLFHPMTIYIGVSSFIYGLAAILIAILNSFNVFNDQGKCLFWSKTVTNCLISAYTLLMFLFIYRADSVLTPEQEVFKRFLHSFVRPFAAIYAIVLLVVCNVDEFGWFLFYQSTDGRFWCQSIPGNVSTITFVVGDACMSVGLFISFYIPLKKVLDENLASSSDDSKKRNLDTAIIRNFWSFLCMWAGTTGSMILFHFAGNASLAFDQVLTVALYSLMGLPSILMLIGGLLLVWNTLDFETTIFMCKRERKYQMTSSEPSLQSNLL